MKAIPIIVLAAMAACFGQVLGAAYDEVGPVTGLVLGGLGGLASATIAMIRPVGDPGVTWKRIELIVFPVFAVVLLALSGTATTFIPVVSAVGVVAVVRLLVESTVGDLAMLERIPDDRPTGTPADRVRLRMLAVGVFLAAVGGYTMGTDAGFSDLARPAVGGLMVSVVAWFGIGIVAVGVVARRARQRVWRVNGVAVADGLSDRWAAGIAAIAVLVVTVSLVFPFVSGQMSAAPAQVISETDGLNRFVSRALELLSRDVNAEQSDRANPDDDNQGSLTELLEPSSRQRPEWLGDVLVLAFIATVFVWAIRLGRSARFDRGGRPHGAGAWDGFRSIMSGILGELRVLISGFVRWLRGLGRGGRRAPIASRSGRPPNVTGMAQRWSPTDAAQRRIARSFTDVVDLEPARPGETPAEVAGTIGRRTDPEGAEVVLGGYLRARYSQRPVSEGDAADVEAAARRVTEAARRDGDG
jgi:hypothetical protein